LNLKIGLTFYKKQEKTKILFRVASFFEDREKKDVILFKRPIVIFPHRYLGIHQSILIIIPPMPK